MKHKPSRSPAGALSAAVLLLALLLTACAPGGAASGSTGPETAEAVTERITAEPETTGAPVSTEPAEPESEEPAEPETEEPAGTEPAEPGVPADPETEAAVRALFAEPRGWYSQALHASFADPSAMDLNELFYAGFPDEEPITEEEDAALAAAFPGSENWAGMWMRLPKEKMCNVLSQYFGLGPDQAEELISNQLFSYYLPEFDCNYVIHSDTNLTSRQIEEVRQAEDGTILFTYRNSMWFGLFDDPICTAALRSTPSGQYQILSNLLGKWITRESLGALTALFEGTGPMRNETESADGVRTVRVLTLKEGGRLVYQEGPSDTEFPDSEGGEWLLGDGKTLYCRIYQADENGYFIGSERYASFACVYDGETLILTQQSKNGFSDDEAGTVLQFPFRPAS